MSEAHGFIQWKGTNVCMDVHCPCGHHSHLDAEFAYVIKCPKCGRLLKTPSTIQLEEVQDAEGFRPIDPDEQDMRAAEMEAMVAVQAMGGTVETSFEQDEQDPTLVRGILTAHPPPGVLVLTLRTKDLREGVHVQLVDGAVRVRPAVLRSDEHPADLDDEGWGGPFGH